MGSFDFAARTSNNVFPGAVDTCLSHGRYSLRHTVVDSAMGQMRVKAALATIHAVEGHHLFSYGPVMGVWAKPKRKVVSEANSF